MLKTNSVYIIAVIMALVFIAVLEAEAAKSFQLSGSDLNYEFRDAKAVDLRTTTISSVVTLREVVKIPPPDEPVLLKTFYEDKLSPLMKSVFQDKKVRGVTINGRYVAVLHTEFDKEYQDILKHELVHAYITLASPKPLPFWFQEGSAVHFSTDKPRKFYGKPSEKQVGAMEGKVVEVADSYKQKLQSFHFLIDHVGKDKFYEWYKQAVETGDVDARPLVGLKPVSEAEAKDKPTQKAIPVWAWCVIGGVVILIGIIGYYTSQRENSYI